LKNIAQASHRNNLLDATLQGKYIGQDIHIIGSGPSATRFKDYDATNDVVIVLNAAAKYFPDADVHLAVENNVWLFDWSINDPPFRGITVLSVDCAESAPVDAYSPGFWNRVLWCHRANWKKNLSIRERGMGLFRVGGFGGSSLCAIHLACIMGASKLHTWGTEFYFPNGEQHFYGDKPYVKTDDIVSLVDFEIVDGEPVTGAGKYQSTSFFVGCSCAIRKVVKHHGVELIDHSGGLLNPAEMK